MFKKLSITDAGGRDRQANLLAAERARIQEAIAKANLPKLALESFQLKPDV
jgi:hypothetical protein